MAGRGGRSGSGEGMPHIHAPDFLSDDVLLKPKLDSIFAEVENCLPSIDFELSDVSSEEESPIFHRALKTPTFDDEKSDNDFSECSDSADFMASLKVAPKPPSLKSSFNAGDNSTSIDKEIAFENRQAASESKSSPALTNDDAFDQAPSLNVALSRMGQELGLSFGDLDFNKSESSRNNDSIQSPRQSFSSTETKLKASEAETNLARKSQRINRPPGSKRRNITDDSPIDESSIELEITSPPVSPRSEKRREIPELSPVRSDSGDDADNSQTISGAMKHKRNIVAPEDDQRKSSTLTNVTQPKIREKYKSEDSGKLVSKYFTNTPQLNLESVDLDNILLGIVTGTKLPGNAGDMKENDKNEPSLIQKLAQASLASTEVRDLDPETGAMRKKKSSVYKDAKTAQNVAVAKQVNKANVSCMGTSTSDLANLPMGELSPRRPISTPEKKTIFLDLRNFEQQKQQQEQKEKANLEKVQRILQIKAESSSESSSDEEGDILMWHEQRRKIKESLSKTGALPPSYFASKPKKPTETRPPAKVIAHTQAQRLQVNLSEQKNKQGAKNSENQSTPPTAEEDEQRKAEAQKRAALNKTQKMKALEESKKKREQREAERQSRVRLGQRLEALRPQASSKGKQDPAEATPTLFDVESSYEPSPLPLPMDTSEPKATQDLVLLSVHLANCGEVIIHRSSTNRSVDTGLGLSATYTSLITWLLSLVPDDFSDSGDSQAPHAPAPFTVLGLQQMYLDGNLVLYVAIKPLQHIDEKTLPETVKKTKKREELKALTPFQLLLTSYLSRNTLQTVCPWLADLVSMEVTSQGPKNFTYRPPLPNITSRPLSTFVQVNHDSNAVQKVFGLEMGFFWETVDSDEQVNEQNISPELDFDTQNTMSLVYKKVFRNPRAMMGIFNRVLQEGLDLAGIRLVYPTPELMDIASGKPVSPTSERKPQQSSFQMVNTIGPVLALALRGTFARTIWLDAVGPSDPVIARKTDPKSLCALFGGESREESLIFCPRNPARVNTELCRWFGGRVPPSGVINTGTAQNQSNKASSGKKKHLGIDKDLPAFKPPACLTATSRGEVFVVISPLVPVKCMGLLLATCQRRGYQMRGIRRVRINSKKASLLGIAVSKVSVFSVTGSTPASPTANKSLSFDFASVKALSEPPRPCTVLLLNKENALHSTASLVEAFMVQMSLLNILGDVQTRVDGNLCSLDLFHVTSFSDQLMTQLGGNFSKTPDADLSVEHGYIAPTLHSNPELEEIVVLTLTGHAFMKNFGLFLGKLQNLVPYSRSNSGLQPVSDGFELLGIKWLPSLSAQHAKQLTPYEVGHKQWKPSIQMLTSEPAVVLVLRGVNAFSRMESLISHKSAHAHHSNNDAPLDRIMSPTPELAYLQATMFFKDHELFADNDARPMLPYLPPPASNREIPDLNAPVQKRPTRQTRVKDVLPALQEESILKTMQAGERAITTVLVVKPDVASKHLSRLLKRIAHEGFRVVAFRQLVLDEAALLNIVPLNDQQNEMLFELHHQYLTQASSVVMCLQRENAVKKLIDLLGPTDPRQAKKQSSFYWRGMFGSDSVANGLYCSRDYKCAVKDQKHFFPSGLCCPSNVELEAEQIPCPAEDDILDKQGLDSRVLQTSAQADPLDQKYCLKTSGMVNNEHPKLTRTSLTQTNCILLTPLLLKAEGRGGKNFPYVHIIDYLHSQGFELTGARMIWMTQQQAQHYLHLIEAGNFSLVPYLTSGASLVLAVQRDNAVIAFEALLGSAFDKESIYSRYNSQILRPKTVAQAKQNLAYFFDSLTPGAQFQIVKTEEEIK